MKAKTLRKNIKRDGILFLLLFLTSNLMACSAQSTSGDEVPNPSSAVLEESIDTFSQLYSRANSFSYETFSTFTISGSIGII